ncbi:uncharacterized protein BKA55DRAFT_592054 [Fusarium redolens]|uniref:N-acetyltransferase domain-containing protein n=1 Tax=Fusarium redolens TaxID=48865 RepID=A0A9P9KJC5_FUSRE|nr:uncharacterized protein BKA55DRAFT_592054 [Fusarium redolens]KAH7259290.1 hypothetical protein BKA55DRAFT_592054 [Fusarium redolens]
MSKLTKSSCKVQMRPLGLDYGSIKTAAEIISLSFASDPLIRWLSRDRSGPGWETLTPTLQQWQEARLREYAVRGIAMEAVTMDDIHKTVGSCFLFPPRPLYRWLNPMWWPSYLRVLWDEWWIQPCEPFNDMPNKLSQRIGIMMDSHNDFEARIKKKYPPNSLHYLEIAAVKPDAQGMGVGKTIMQWVVQKIGDSPCYIECTDKKNVAFYVKYGFEVVEEKELVDEEDAMPSTTLFYMVRDKSESLTCVQAGMTCEGYKTRLTWGSSDTASSAGAGIVLNPVRPPRQKNKSLRDRRASPAVESVGDPLVNLPDFSSIQSPDELDLLCLQFESFSEGLPDEEVSQKLMNTYSICLKHACLAYQASLDVGTSHLTPLYMQSALSNYLNDLDNPSMLCQDVTLATGVLLCSVSINSLYIWSPLLKGLHGVLQARELLNDPQRPPLADHLLEAVALLDIPFFTLNRITPSLEIWKSYVQPNKHSGIEQVSGIPYSLMNLLANMDSTTIENDLLQWPGELGDEFAQIHLWEAFRLAGILHSRCLADHCQDRTTPPIANATTEILRMKVFASIQAIIGIGTFNFRLSLARAILYPLFIAGILAENAQEQQLTRVAFQYIMQKGQEGTEQIILDIVEKVWKNGKGGNEASKLTIATEATGELNAEIHLY